VNRDSAGAGNEGLTRQQLDLISQIMQQTKQASAGLEAAGQKSNQRPRTWNMQVSDPQFTLIFHRQIANGDQIQKDANGE
jgi:hypothetical protein